MEYESSKGSWFLIMASWQMGADLEAIQRFHEVYKYLRILTPGPERQAALDGLPREDPRLSLVPDSLKSLNLIGRRQFVIVCQIKSENCNRILQELSKIIILEARISVEIFPATYVHDLNTMLPTDEKYYLKST
jgi:hypothetical protein